MNASSSEQTRVVLWSVVTALVLVVRFLAVLVTAVCVIAWVIAMVRDSWNNMFFIPAIVAAAALLVSTYLYSYLRARYPRRNGRLL
ncbi:hypothetical protein [Gordonia otitidis]|uniref:hypothetical protein n=1 Tax=Gordonia otitidis TaxID=249058 RepID=UPI0002D348C5|nr:hypothetical protein [Gordonia otitidis]UEA60831.1 hypothetical protein LK459_08400 [Gordonia otitidis]